MTVDNVVSVVFEVFFELRDAFECSRREGRAFPGHCEVVIAAGDRFVAVRGAVHHPAFVLEGPDRRNVEFIQMFLRDIRDKEDSFQEQSP